MIIDKVLGRLGKQAQAAAAERLEEEVYAMLKGKDFKDAYFLLNRVLSKLALDKSSG
ncbi:Uncharacterised protein [uncultured archaeon]|nr:Uncharacterised protein [uncultured archaeon]